MQLQGLHLSVQLRQEFARVESLAHKTPSMTSMKAHRISSHQVGMLQGMRRSFSNLELLISEHALVFDADIIAQELLDCAAAYQILDIRAFGASAEQANNSLESKYSAVWTSDLQSMCAAVKLLCPDWTDACKESMFTDRALVQSMLDLPNADAAKIGPLCTEFQSQLNFERSLHGAPLVDPTVLSSAQSMQRFGCATVIYRAVIVSTERDWLTLTSPAEAAVAVQELKNNIASKGVVLKEQMAGILDQWESGERLKELDAMRQASAGSGAGDSPSDRAGAGIDVSPVQPASALEFEMCSSACAVGASSSPICDWPISGDLCIATGRDCTASSEAELGRARRLGKEAQDRMMIRRAWGRHRSSLGRSRFLGQESKGSFRVVYVGAGIL